MSVKIPLTMIGISFYYRHWVNVAEMTHEGYKDIFCLFSNSYYSFGLLKETAGNDFVFALTHKGGIEGLPRSLFLFMKTKQIDEYSTELLH